jgi:hypothetical protein
MMSTREALATVHGGGRVALGALCVIAPGTITRTWLGTTSGSTALLTRAIGGRDVGIGAGLALNASDPAVARGWLLAGMVSDGVDLASTLARRSALPPSGVAAMALTVTVSLLWQGWLAATAKRRRNTPADEYSPARST